jgi:hypothetical protein
VESSGPIRRTIRLVFALALILVGLYALYVLMLVDVEGSVVGKLLAGASLLLGFGWLWGDVIRPTQVSRRTTPQREVVSPSKRPRGRAADRSSSQRPSETESRSHIERISIFQKLMISIFVRKYRSCEVGWVRASFTRQSVTMKWALSFLVMNGSSNREPSKVAITSQDLLPSGLEQADSGEIAHLHEQLGQWLDYWSERYPDDTLEQAMWNLLVRLLQAKEDWVAECGNERFPFDLVMAATVAGKLEGYVDEKVLGDLARGPLLTR